MKNKFDKRSKYLRSLIVRCLIGSNRGHMGSAMSLVEIFRVLYDHIIKFDPKKPKLENRDRVILSKGHGCLALYAILADKKFINLKELDNVSSFNSSLGGHPEAPKIKGVEASTGALGHGLSVAVGMAIGFKLDNKPYKVYTLLGDGELSEGSIWESLLSASKYKLDNLVIIIDRNGLQITGKTEEVNPIEPLLDKFNSFGLCVNQVNGNSVSELDEIFKKIPFENNQPNLIIANTVKGKGVSFIENQVVWHHKLPSEDEYNKAVEELYKQLEHFK